ncbi:MAG: S1C family serine protease [Candidatus Thiothrix sulfatifontis]|nr:MAG: S1C family serine protease [Candidatus Thiothrix sulfatifontis]
MLNQGDVILSFAGKPIANAAALPPVVGSIPIGEAVAVEILREGKRETLTLTVREQVPQTRNRLKLRWNNNPLP